MADTSDGAIVIRGPQGQKGDPSTIPGPIGPAGPAGKDGKDGKDGVSIRGIQGQKGDPSTIPGPIGPAGPIGPRGPVGPAPDIYYGIGNPPSPIGLKDGALFFKY